MADKELKDIENSVVMLEGIGDNENNNENGDDNNDDDESI